MRGAPEAGRASLRDATPHPGGSTAFAHFLLEELRSDVSVTSLILKARRDHVIDAEALPGSLGGLQEALMGSPQSMRFCVSARLRA
ncbi:hypothetical protein KSX_63130 [Ktedonospora formicarum]|uniref:Uncharacterized protein n=1 Tax=Ktedonospora formicarum TaxID=2778364 RepID=A0A8J3I796_9CHLR|nr:hypothetical protein KSX_63130 [Ktedonospora formicarum]